jgi:hypothetical protein
MLFIFSVRDVPIGSETNYYYYSTKARMTNDSLNNHLHYHVTGPEADIQRVLQVVIKVVKRIFRKEKLYGNTNLALAFIVVLFSR